MIETLTEVLDQPGVTRALESKIVRKQTEQFKVFLESIFVKSLNRVVYRFKRIFTWTNIILINAVVISYYAGRANAVTLPNWWDIFKDFDVFWDKTIIVNALFFIFRFLKQIVSITLRITIVLILLYLLYKGFQWLYLKLVGKQ